MYTILGPDQFKYKMNIRNTKWQMSGTNAFIRNTYIMIKRNRMQRILFLTHANFSTHAKISWTHACHSKILTHTIFLFDPRQKFYGPTRPTPKFLIHLIFLPTPNLFEPRPLTHPRYPRHLRYLVDFIFIWISEN